MVFVLALWLRLAGSGWDDWAGLHPDERHLIFALSDALAGLAQAQGTGWGELWFATGLSPLDPRGGGRFYVYGGLPHLTMTLLAHARAVVGWEGLLALTRNTTAIIDAYTCLAVFMLAMLLLRHGAAALAACFFYAVAPLALQHANFFTVDPWLTAAVAWGLVAAVLLAAETRPRRALLWAALAGALAAVALACKLPGALLCPGLVAAAYVRLRRHRSKGRLAVELALSVVVFLVTLRLVAPFSFAGPGLLDLRPSPAMIGAYLEAARVAGSPEFPPNWQWMAGYGPLQALRDMALMALGPALAAAAGVGVATGIGAAVTQRGRGAQCGRNAWRRATPLILVTTGFCAYGLFGRPPMLRYMLPAVPGLCVVAGAAMAGLWDSWRGRGVVLAVLGCALFWGAGMARLHSALPNSRIAASYWLWANTGPGVVIAHESSWDESLPLPVRLDDRPERIWPEQGGRFAFVNLGLEAPETPAKAARIAEALDRADLLVISSERLRRPMLALPGRFAMTGAYYALLADGRLCFAPVYRSRSVYPLPGLPLADGWVQEPWSVYDHPAVEIYRKTGCFARAQVEARLLAALDTNAASRGEAQ
ncbi:MAG: glycosyltransferase family 39 protein [Rhodocyclaceae bacterium]|nr:glycosyltransferase family 39 protein [Rhodocyclaceae bacterium]